MDELERLTTIFEAHADVEWKLDALLDVGQFRDARVVTLLLTVVGSPTEAIVVRQAALKQLPKNGLTELQRVDVARVLADIVTGGPSADAHLSAQAAEALGQFVDVDRVVGCLGSCAMDSRCDFDVRYAAFTALEGSGATDETIAIFNYLCADDTFGRSAQRILARWGVGISRQK